MRDNFHWLLLSPFQGYFNSRLCTRGNLCVERTRTYRAISIHASTWEATEKKYNDAVADLFQFTPLHERRHRVQFTPSLQKVFQFTPLHKRQRKSICFKQKLYGISIHASTWEATTQTRLLMRQLPYFNSRLYMRGNSCSFGGYQTGHISIHASTWEATHFPILCRNK